MSIAKQLQTYLKQHEIKYHLVTHPHTGSSMESAEEAHVPGDALAKGILVATAKDGYRLVVVPSDYHVDLESLHQLLKQEITMATEAELGQCFPDCEVGAVPPIGPAYDIKTLWDPDSSLGNQDKIYFEAGDHEHLVQLSGRSFHELMAPAERGEFSRHI
jgi:Ala-tRNA(Pro) deacylase